MQRNVQILLLISVLCVGITEGSMAQSNNFQRRGEIKTMRVFNGEFGSELKPHETREYLVRMRTAGLAHDAAQIPLLMQVVRETTAENHFVTALHSLAQIGGAQALQVTEEALLNIREIEPAARYASVVRARLLAQSAAHKLTNPTLPHRATVCLNTFLQTLGHADASALNTAVKKQVRDMQFMVHPETGRDIYALRELADIIYHAHDIALLQVAKAAGIDFTLDAGASYKAQLAPLTAMKRIDWIVEHLSSIHAFTFQDTFLVQLAADEGKMASRAAAAKLHEMDQHREQYADNLKDSKGRTHRYFPGYYGLLYIIEAVGDSDQAPMLARNLNNPEPAISSNVQQIYKTVESGIPLVRRPGY